MYVSLSYSRINGNSDFGIKYPLLDQYGNFWTSVYTSGDFGYWANRILVGYQNGRAKVNLGIYLTQQAPYFEETTTFIVPLVGCSFNIGKL